jgi:uncharacterized membrane protein
VSIVFDPTCIEPVRSAPRPRQWFGDVVLVVFLLAQVFDGAFTYLGVAAVGITEGNPLIAHYANHIGIGPSLAVAKVLASICAIVLHLLALHRVLAALTFIYLSLAVFPWSYLIFVVH